MVMVQLQENQIVITIPTPSPAETLAEIQHGIIEMMKTMLASGTEGKDLELDRPTANGGYFALELLQATLFDPATVEAAQAMANMIQSRGKEAE
jgi:hypothetical protein